MIIGRKSEIRPCASTARRTWNGLAFERVCLEHIDQLKRALGISGVRTVEYAWFRRGGDGREGAQIDLLIKRADNAVNICEMKYASEAYVAPVGVVGWLQYEADICNCPDLGNLLQCPL